MATKYKRTYQNTAPKCKNVPSTKAYRFKLMVRLNNIEWEEERKKGKRNDREQKKNAHTNKEKKS